MENIRQNLFAAQINCLRSLDSNSKATQETVEPQLRIIQMNWMIRKFQQDQLKLLQQLQQDQQKLFGDVAPTDEQQQQQQATEGPVDLPPPALSADEADHLEESMELQENLLKVLGQTSLGQASMRAGETIKAAHGPTATTTKLRLHPYQFRQSAHGPNIAALQLTGPIEVDVRYHGSMARSFGNKGKEFAPWQRERRMRNNQAGRIYRAKMRAIGALLEKESTASAAANNNRKVLVAQKRVYIARLLKLLGLPAKDLAVEWEQQKPSDDVQELESNECD